MSCRFIHFIIDTFEFLCCSKLWTKLATTWWCTFDKYTTPQIFRLFRSPGSYNNIVSSYKNIVVATIILLGFINYRMLGMYYFLNNNINFHNYIEKTLVMSRQFFTIYYVFIHLTLIGEKSTSSLI